MHRSPATTTLQRPTSHPESTIPNAMAAQKAGATWTKAVLLAALTMLLTFGSLGVASAAGVTASTTATQQASSSLSVIAVNATPGPALMATASCGGGRCTVYFSKSETRALGSGKVPAPPGALPLQLKVAYYAAAYGHRWFAQQYANRGWCSGFRVSIFPWESQGYFGYACNWN